MSSGDKLIVIWTIKNGKVNFFLMQANYVQIPYKSVCESSVCMKVGVWSGGGGGKVINYGPHYHKINFNGYPDIIIKFSFYI